MMLSLSVEAIEPPVMNFTDCDSIKKEVEIFGKTMPSGLRRFKEYFNDCNITTINQIEINDYFNMEYDTLLTLAYLSFKEKNTHKRLLQYYIEWDRIDG